MEHGQIHTDLKPINGKRLKELILFRLVLVILAIIIFIGYPRTFHGEYLHISMERSICLGTCPAYNIDVYGSGLVIYKGNLHVHDKGFRIEFVSQGKIQEIIAALNSSQYFSLNDSYIYSVTDNPGTLIFIHYKGKSKEIYHYPDGRAPNHDVAPPALGELEGQIENLAIGWIE